MNRILSLILSLLFVASTALATLPVGTPLDEYTGDNSTDTFAYTWKIWADSDLVVEVDDVLQTITTDYTVTGAGADGGGNVIFVSPPATNTEIEIYRVIPVNRTTDYTPGGPLYADTLDDDIDRVVALVQDAGWGVSRSLRFPAGDTTAAEIASKADRAGNFLAFDDEGNLSFPGTPLTYNGQLAENYATLRAIGISTVLDKDPAIVQFRSAKGDGGGGSFYWDSSDLSTEVALDTLSGIYVAPDSDPTGASGAWVRQVFGPVSVLWFGADNTGTSDSADAFSQAIIHSVGLARGEVYAPRGLYRTNSTVPILKRGVTIRGDTTPQRYLPGSNIHGTQVEFYGAGEMFEIGTDSGNDWDTAEYDGLQEITFENIYLNHGNPTDALDNGAGNYEAGTYGIRDWRGGDLRLKSVVLSNFDYPFWGIQSDVSRWDDVLVKYNHSGCYFGPRTDQFVAHRFYAFLNDKVATFDKCNQPTLYNPVFVGNGSANDYTLEMLQGSRGLTLYSPWFEHVSGNLTGTKPWIGIGVNPGYLSGNPTGNTSSVNGVRIYDPTIFGAQFHGGGGDHNMEYLAEIDKAIGVKITDPKAYGGIYNIKSLAHILSADAACHIDFQDDSWNTLIYTVEAGAEASFLTATKNIKFQNFYGGGRLYMRGIPESGDTTAFLQTEGGARRFMINFPDAGTDWSTQFQIDAGRKVLHYYQASSVGDPTSLTWQLGDKFYYTDPIAGGFMGRVCTETGTQGTYSEGLTIALDSGQTTGTLSGATTVLKPQQRIKIAGAGVASADLDTIIDSISGTSITVTNAASTTVAAAVISFNAATFEEFGAIAN